MQVRQQLRKLRLERGISQTFMAKKLGFSYPSGYSNIEAGRNRLGYDQALKIADILNVDVSELSEDESNFFDVNLHKKCNNPKSA